MKKIDIKFKVSERDYASVKRLIINNYGPAAFKIVNKEFVAQELIEFGYKEIQLEEQLLAAAFNNKINYDVLNDWQVEPSSAFAEKTIPLSAKINSVTYTRILNSLEYLYPENRYDQEYKPNDFLAQLGIVYAQRQVAEHAEQGAFK